MAAHEPKKPKAMKNGIVYTQDFEVYEMNELAVNKSRNQNQNQNQFTTTTSYTISSTPRPTKSSHKSLASRWLDSFRRVDGGPISQHHGYNSFPQPAGDRFYDLDAANIRTANTGLHRHLKGRHLQMIAIGGSIGTGLFVTSGIALYQSGPLPLLLAYIFTGILQYCTMQSLGELVVTFPVAGAFSALSTRFLDPSWGFSIGWNYALQWLFTLPLEIIAGALTVQYWNNDLSKSIFITIFLLVIIIINLFGIKGYGEAEFLFSIVKVTAIVGFILLGVVINIGGPPHGGYIGGQYWQDPGLTNHGFKGFCSVLVISSFSFAGTELVGLAAAETENPRKSLPSAIKQVFWRIAIFYIVSLLLIGLLVPYNEPRLVAGQSSVDASASPFVIAVESAGSTILPSVMNAVVLISVLSVGNSAVFGSSRTLAALAEQSHAPKILSYVDFKGRPLISVLVAAGIGLLSYLAELNAHDEIFSWLLAISGLSSLFTWGSICLCHIQFRRAWAKAGNNLTQLPFRSQAGVIGSYIGLCGNFLVLVSQIWIAISPIQTPGAAPETAASIAKNVMLNIMAVPIILVFYIGHKLWFRTKIVSIRDMDLDTGRSFSRLYNMHTDYQEKRQKWPLWKRVYKSLC